MTLLSIIPIGGIPIALGTAMFLLQERGNGEVTSVPAEARGTLLAFALSHVVYTLAAVIVFL